MGLCVPKGQNNEVASTENNNNKRTAEIEYESVYDNNECGRSEIP